MKTSLFCTAAAACVLLSGVSLQAGAAESADLTVTGTIRPAACNITLGNNGTVDFGTISAQSMSSTALTELTNDSMSLQITCDASTAVGIDLTDNRADSKITVADVENAQLFGLGKSGETNIGAYAIEIPGQGSAGSNTTWSISSADGTGNWSSVANNSRTRTDRIYSWSTVGAAATTPSTLTTVTQPLRVRAWLNNTTNLPVSSNISLDGSATITVVYL